MAKARDWQQNLSEAEIDRLPSAGKMRCTEALRTQTDLNVKIQPQSPFPISRLDTTFFFVSISSWLMTLMFVCKTN